MSCSSAELPRRSREIKSEEFSLEHSPGQQVGLAEVSVLPGVRESLERALTERAGTSSPEDQLGSENSARRPEVRRALATPPLALWLWPSTAPPGRASRGLREVAHRLGLEYLDTGANVRASAGHAWSGRGDLADRSAVAEVTGLDLRLRPIRPSPRSSWRPGRDRTDRESRISAR